jgi:putative transposase
VPLLTRTLRFPLTIQSSNYPLLASTQQEYTRAAQYVYDYCYTTKITGQVKVHHATYKPIRKNSMLPSQLIISARTKAIELAKSLQAVSNKKAVTWQKTLPIRYDKRSATINLPQQTVSLVTLNGRIHASFQVPTFYLRYLDWDFRSFELIYNKHQQRYYAHFVVNRSIESSTEHSKVYLGVDRGIRHIAVASNNNFYSGSALREVKSRNFRLKRSLQKKGTRSAKRHLFCLRGREQRFQKDVNHCISKALLSSVPPNSTLILEELTDIRQNAKVRRKSRQKRELHNWAFYQFQTFLAYKAMEKNITIEYVDPAYTSQQCSKCDHISRANRLKSQFHCRKCGFSLNADLNASRNIRSKYLRGLIMPEELQASLVGLKSVVLS